MTTEHMTRRRKAQWGIAGKWMLTAALWATRAASTTLVDQGTCTVSVKQSAGLTAPVSWCLSCELQNTHRC